MIRFQCSIHANAFHLHSVFNVSVLIVSLGMLAQMAGVDPSGTSWPGAGWILALRNHPNRITTFGVVTLFTLCGWEILEMARNRWMKANLDDSQGLVTEK
jgi:hypothetical protein